MRPAQSLECRRAATGRTAGGRAWRVRARWVRARGNWFAAIALLSSTVIAVRDTPPHAHTRALRPTDLALRALLVHEVLLRVHPGVLVAAVLVFDQPDLERLRQQWRERENREGQRAGGDIRCGYLCGASAGHARSERRTRAPATRTGCLARLIGSGAFAPELEHVLCVVRHDTDVVELAPRIGAAARPPVPFHLDRCTDLLVPVDRRGRIQVGGDIRRRGRSPGSASCRGPADRGAASAAAAAVAASRGGARAATATVAAPRRTMQVKSLHQGQLS